jgi:hypothetical protein
LLPCFLLLLCYLSTLEPSLKALSLNPLSLKPLSLNPLSRNPLNQVQAPPFLNTPSKKMGGTIRAPQVSDLTVALHVSAALRRGIVARSHRT